MFVDWLKTLFLPRRIDTPSTSRLSSEQAVAMAQEAAATDPLASTLTMATVVNREGAAIWVVGAPAMGRTLVVEIDDETGRVLRIERVGLR